MGRRTGLPLEQRNMAIGMITGGMMVKEVAQHFHVKVPYPGSEQSTVKQAPLKTDHVLADR